MKKIIVMIPARLGSKRIPLKNIRYMLDKPLIQYPIELAEKCLAIDSVWLNTEDEKLGRIAEKMKINYHKRPKELATDTATNREFTYEFLKKHKCDYVVMLNPTSPLLRASTLEEFIKLVNNSDFDTILSVISEKAETFYHSKPINFTLDKKINSQFLEPVEKIIWALTAWKRDTFIYLEEKGLNPIFGGNIGTFEIPKDEACDLDTDEDWNIAEGILLSRKNKSNINYLEL